MFTLENVLVEKTKVEIGHSKNNSTTLEQALLNTGFVQERHDFD
jgi:hypothetical protein